jgi:hypothetical protein
VRGQPNSQRLVADRRSRRLHGWERRQVSAGLVVELSCSNPGDKGPPFARVEAKLRTLRVLGVRYENVAGRKPSHSDTVASRAPRADSPFNRRGCRFPVCIPPRIIHSVSPALSVLRLPACADRPNASRGRIKLRPAGCSPVPRMS